LQLQTAGTTAVTVDASQNVGIGVTPSAWRSAFNVTYGERALELTYSALVTQAGPNTILANNVYFNSSNQWIYKNAVANTNAGLYTIGSDGLHTWSVAPTGASGAVATFTQVLSINKDKSLALQGATAATGAGITFPATQSASSDANTLDDYEEGLWTPAYSFGNGTTGITYSTQSGGYIKVGAQVTIWALLVLSNKGSSTGQTRITGLPFTNANASGRSEGATAVFNYWQNFATAVSPLGYVGNNSTQIILTNYAAATSVGTLSDANFGNSTSVYFVATYSTV
jgi:hypothetical protein